MNKTSVVCINVEFDNECTTAAMGFHFRIDGKKFCGKHPAKAIYVMKSAPSADEMLRLRSYLVKFAEESPIYWWPGRGGLVELEAAVGYYEKLWSPVISHTGLIRVGSPGQQLSRSATKCSDSAELLTFPGMCMMEPVLDALDDVRRRYRMAMLYKSKTELDKRRTKVHEAANALWSEFAATRGKAAAKTTAAARGPVNASINLRQVLHEQGLSAPELDLGAIPRVLILGESGAGKTLVANYLATRADPDQLGPQSRPLVRMAIPSFLGSEDRFEWELFGYLPGAYTGARDEGSLGSALQLIGGVLFLDEIGEASATLQAKMLAFMDDFRISPRGWEGEGFTCPLLLVAATNRDVRKWAQEGLDGADTTGFRHDLYWRYDTVIDLPSLNDRKETEMSAIVDSLLQLNSINPNGQAVTHYQVDVITKLRSVDYKNSNFRLLTRLLKEAVKRAQNAKRKSLFAEDIVVNLFTATA